MTLTSHIADSAMIENKMADKQWFFNSSHKENYETISEFADGVLRSALSALDFAENYDNHTVHYNECLNKLHFTSFCFD